MATTLDALVKQVRRFMRDWPAPTDSLTASITSSATTLTVADTTRFIANGVMEVDYELLLVQSISNATTLTVARGWAGSTAVSHATSASTLIRPGYFSVEIVDAINAAQSECYPYIYRPVIDASLTGAALKYEFTVPNMPGTYGGDTIVMPFVSRMEMKEPGDFAYRWLQDWTIRRSSTPVIQFRRPPTVGATIRTHGFGPFPDMSAPTDTVDTLFPKNAERALVLCAASILLSSGEAGRTRQDVGARDDREAANKPGNAIALATQLERRFEKELARVGMPPFPKGVRTSL